MGEQVVQHAGCLDGADIGYLAALSPCEQRELRFQQPGNLLNVLIG